MGSNQKTKKKRRGIKKMKLRNFISEMSLPIIKNAEHAVDIIRQANDAVGKGLYDNDLYGALHAAAKYLLDDPSTKYNKYLKMAQTAKKEMIKYRSKTSPHQKKMTTMQKRLD